MNDANFQPDWASAPGETISDILAAREWTLDKFCERVSLKRSFAERLLEGKAAINDEIADKLQAVLGSTKAFWMQREEHYQRDLARRPQNIDNNIAIEWLEDLPVSDMIKFGWVSKTETKLGQAQECLGFFNVPTVNEWQKTYGNICQAVAFKQTGHTHTNAKAITAWIQMGKRKTASIDCLEWNPKKLREHLPQVRQLTRRSSPNLFLNELKEICGEAGVALAVVRAPKGCTANGATWFDENGKPIILLSDRYKTDDHFWFAFFHEVGHLLLHDKNALFIESAETVSDLEEKQANQFAANIIIPEGFESILQGVRHTHRAVIRLASEIGISPGLLVGQLQRRKILSYKWLNKLKRRYDWSEVL